MNDKPDTDVYRILLQYVIHSWEKKWKDLGMCRDQQEKLGLMTASQGSTGQQNKGLMTC